MTHSYSRAMPQQVPLTVYQQVVSDLETAHMRLAQMSGDYDQLKQQYQQLQAEVQMVSQRLQSLAPRTPVWATPPEPPAATEPTPDFEFLNHLKRRQQTPANGSPQPSPVSGRPPVSPPTPPSDPRLDTSRLDPRFEHPELNRQPAPEARPSRNRYANRYEPAAPNLDHLENLFTDPGSAYDTENSAYRRARDQHAGSSMSWVWIGVAVVLIIGSFGAGFLVVQPFVSGDPSETPTLPTPTTP